MTLLKISEPANLNKKLQKKSVVGIDLGTTNSLVATVVNDKPITVPVSENNDILPSVVHYNQDYSVTVGDKAKGFLVSDPHNTINSVKRCLGKNINEINDKNKLFSYQMADPATNLSNDDKQIPYFDTQVGPKSPVQVSAEILQKLKLCAEAFIKAEIQGVVVTVPAYFDETQRRLTKDAVRIAGLPLLRLINEPTAAAIAYGLDKNNNDEIIAVYDLGGGTFDISILKLENGIFEVLATGGDNNFGGDDIDSLLALWILKNAEIEKNKLNASQLRLLLNIAKHAKEQLHNDNSVVIKFLDWQGNLTKDIFNEIIEPSIARTINILRSTLIDANISHENLDHIVLVGGSTRIQQIRDKLKDFCAKEPLCQVDPDRVVALGAAIQADILAGNNKSELLLLDVVPLSLGIESMGGIMEKIIDRNTKIPATKSQYFTTYQDGQTDIIINVFQGDRELVKDNRSLAKFILKDIKAMAAGVAKIIVTFQIDADGMLSVSAMEQSTGKEKSIEVKPSYGLTDEDIQNMLLDSYSNAEADHQNKVLQQQIIESGYLINATQKLIDESDNSISVEEKNQMTELVKQLNIACDNHTKTEIVNTKQKLSSLTEKIAKKQIKFAVEGRKLSNFEEH